MISSSSSFFFFTDTATTEIYTLSLHDALPILSTVNCPACWGGRSAGWPAAGERGRFSSRSEEHTSELQSQFHLVCRLLLEKKKMVGMRSKSASLIISFSFVVTTFATIVQSRAT